MAEKHKYQIYVLTSFRRISESKGKVDLVGEMRTRTVNIDPDCKRDFISMEDGSVSPVTVPHADLGAALITRAAMESIRKRGLEATPEMIIEERKVLVRTTRFRGGEAVTLARAFARGITQGHIATDEPLPGYKAMAERFNRIWELMGLSIISPFRWKVDHFKNAKNHARWEPGVMTTNPSLERLVELLCTDFRADADYVKHLLFMPDSFIEATFPLLEQVVRAVLRAPGRMIQPFLRLHEAGFLPDRERLKEVFPQLTDGHITTYLNKPFHPAELKSCDYCSLYKIFYRLGIPAKHSRDCARAIAPFTARDGGTHRNPAHKSCLESFVIAMHQANITACRLPVKLILKRLERYGLSERNYYALRHGKLEPNALKDTRANRWQISLMARAVGMDPQLFTRILLKQAGQL